MKLDPPRLTRSPLSGAVYVVTHGKIVGTKDGQEIVESSVKYDVTDQFDVLVKEWTEER